MSDSETTRRRFLRTVPAATVAVGLAGCTGGSSEETAPEDYSLPAASDHVSVKMGPNGTNSFAPEIVHVTVGGTVEWTLAGRNHSATAYHPDNDHALRIPEDADPWDSGVLLDDGASFSHTFETPGVYDYYCTPHEPLGMVGSVVVGDPDPEGQPGLKPPGKKRTDAAEKKLKDLNAKVRSSL